MTAPWLKGVLRELEEAFVVLTECEAGRAPCGGVSFVEQRQRAVAKAQEKVERARALYERQSATLPAKSRRRAAMFFGAVYLLQRQAAYSGPDTVLAGRLQRFEGVAN